MKKLLFNRISRSLLVMALLVLLFALTGCGGQEAGASTPKSVYAGQYQVEIFLEDNPAASFDRGGGPMLNLVVTVDANGTVSGSGSYHLDDGQAGGGPLSGALQNNGIVSATLIGPAGKKFSLGGLMQEVESRGGGQAKLAGRVSVIQTDNDATTGTWGNSLCKFWVVVQ